MLKKYSLYAATLVLATLLCGPLQAETGSEWRFRVLLDDKEIGFHHFTLDEKNGERRLTSQAEFEVKLLFVKLFEYQHRNEEVWRGDCLTSIDSETDSNGEPFAVSGQLRDDRFTLQGAQGIVELPACVMTFAYWNPDFLTQKRLLNSQNGEFLEVQITPAEPDRLDIGGEPRNAYRYRLRAGDMDLLLWYSEQSNDWLALETEAKGGRKLRYERL